MIKVGETFEIVKVLGHQYSEGRFKIGGSTIRRSEHSDAILNGDYKHQSEVFKSKYMFNQSALYLRSFDVKVMGRLIVRKVK